jgi:flagellar hook-associated protein 1
MGLSSATSVAQSSLAAIAAESAAISRNIAGVNVSGTFSEKTATVVTTGSGGVQANTVTRAQNPTLFIGVLSATSSSATQSVISDGLSTLEETVGDTNSDTSPAAKLSDFMNALQSYESTPSDESLASAAVTAAGGLATTLNSATQTVQQVREQADTNMASSVSTINNLLGQFQSVNAQIVKGSATGSDISDLEDTRDTILTQLSQQVGISTTTGPNNDMSIYTDSGVTLFQGGSPQSVTFQQTSAYAPGTVGNAVFVGGVPITGSAATMPIQSGSLAGYASLRDDTTVTYQSQLDQISNGLISATAETLPSGGTAPGLFSYQGADATGTPPQMPATTTGLGAEIQVNPAVDPTQGGSPDLVRDGINTTFNTAGDASFSTQLQNLTTGLNATQTFASSGEIGKTPSNISDYASASVSWLEAARQNNSNESSFQSTLLTSTTTALSSATGVSLDNEMSKMLDLENSYSSSAQLMTTINNMFSSLVSAVTTIAGNAG